MTELTPTEIWNILDDVTDPEIPVVSVVEMGLIRQVGLEGERVIVEFSPTFAGCPALQVMREEIERRLYEAGAGQVEVRVVHKPPWTSDWITPAGRKKLRDFGLAPPPRHAGHFEELLEKAVCPYCGSGDTSLKNSFGSSLCRAIYYCNACQQPFEQFKPI
jgi:ring-1,2-phenylacetyl-CoA epoxidase subunit PaaD